jgi:hypothetical protein
MGPFGNGPLWRPLQRSAVSRSPLSSPTIMAMAAAGTVGADMRAVGADTQAVVDTGVGRRTSPAGVVMEAAAVVEVEAAHRTWLAVETGAAADMEAARTLTPADKRTGAEGIPEAATTSPMPIAARICIKPLDTRINRFPQIEEKAPQNKTGQTARLNTER